MFSIPICPYFQFNCTGTDNPVLIATANKYCANLGGRLPTGTLSPTHWSPALFWRIRMHICIQGMHPELDRKQNGKSYPDQDRQQNEADLQKLLKTVTCTNRLYQ
jgi:hypothetical protein